MNVALDQTKIWVLTIPNRPKYGYWANQRNPNVAFAQNEQTDGIMDINQNEQTEIYVLNIPKRLKFGYWLCRTNQNMGFAQTEQIADRNTDVNRTEIWLLNIPNRPK